MSMHDLCKMALCVALYCVSAYIFIPLPFTTAVITAMTIAFNLAAFILTPKQTLLTLIAWLFLGSVGLPVFAGGTAGLGKVFGPTGGFIIGFVIAYPLVSYFKGKKNSLLRYTLSAVCIGIPITYIGGVISMMAVLDIGLWEACIMAVFPFIPGDIAKSVLAAFIGIKLNRILPAGRS